MPLTDAEKAEAVQQEIVSTTLLWRLGLSDWITEETESVLVNCLGRAGVLRIAHDDVQMLPDRFPFDLGRIVWGDDVEGVRCLDLASQAAGLADSV